MSFYGGILGPGVEYQEHFLGAKVAGAWGWQSHHLNVPNVMEIWEPKFPGTLWATPGLLRDSFTFFMVIYLIFDLHITQDITVMKYWAIVLQNWIRL